MKENEVACDNILDLCDGGCTFCCMLDAGHGGPHRDEFEEGDQLVVIVWHDKKFRVAIAKEE